MCRTATLSEGPHKLHFGDDADNTDLPMDHFFSSLTLSPVARSQPPTAPSSSHKGSQRRVDLFLTPTHIRSKRRIPAVEHADVNGAFPARVLADDPSMGSPMGSPLRTPAGPVTRSQTRLPAPDLLPPSMKRSHMNVKQHRLPVGCSPASRRRLGGADVVDGRAGGMPVGAVTPAPKRVLPSSPVDFSRIRKAPAPVEDVSASPAACGTLRRRHAALRGALTDITHSNGLAPVTPSKGQVAKRLRAPTESGRQWVQLRNLATDLLDGTVAKTPLKPRARDNMMQSSP
jgi:hypothetical protein